MENEEFRKRKKELDEIHEKNLMNLYREYAHSNAKFKLGDWIKDERWAFVVDKITTSKFMSEFPSVVYHGFELKKDLTPRKDRNRVAIYGNGAELIRSA